MRSTCVQQSDRQGGKSGRPNQCRCVRTRHKSAVPCAPKARMTEPYRVRIDNASGRVALRAHGRHQSRVEDGC